MCFGSKLKGDQVDVESSPPARKVNAPPAAQFNQVDYDASTDPTKAERPADMAPHETEASPGMVEEDPLSTKKQENISLEPYKSNLAGETPAMVQ